MRVSNDTLRSAFLAALESAQRRVIDTQEKVSSGKRVNKPSDDPVAAARIAHLDASLSRLDQYKSNSDFARNQLGLEESALSSVIDNLQRVRELALQGNNSTANDSDRKDIAAEIRQARDALLALANTTDVDGRHLFGGYVEGAVPFTHDGEWQCRLQRRPGPTFLADQRQPVRCDQRLRFRRVPEDSAGQWHVHARRQPRQHRQRRARRRHRRESCRMGARHVPHQLPYADDLRGSRQRQRARVVR